MFYVMAWFILIISSLHYFFPSPKGPVLAFSYTEVNEIFVSAKNGVEMEGLPQ